MLCFSELFFPSEKEERRNVNIVFVGDSITYGAKLNNPLYDAPPVRASVLLQQSGVGKIQFANCGYSGCTTMDFLPDTGILFPLVEEAADKFYRDRSPKLIFSILLGANDSANLGEDGLGITPEHHVANMRKIIDRLQERYNRCRVVVHRPLWYSPRAYNEVHYLQGGLVRLGAYQEEIKKMIVGYSVDFPGQVWVGDQDGYDYFRQHYATDLTPEEGSSGVFYLHPNKKGAAKLGELWAKAILKVIKAGKN